MAKSKTDALGFFASDGLLIKTTASGRLPPSFWGNRAAESLNRLVSFQPAMKRYSVGREDRGVRMMARDVEPGYFSGFIRTL